MAMGRQGKLAPFMVLVALVGVRCVIYYEATVVGPKDSSEVDGVAAVYEKQEEPIVGKCSDYALTVAKLTVSLNSCPVFIAPNATGSGELPWVVGIVYGGVHYWRHLIWKPELISPANGMVDWARFAFSANTMASMVNQALASSFAEFASKNSAAPQARKVPALRYDTLAQAFVWAVPSNWLTKGPANPELRPAEARITINWSLQSRLDGWRSQIIGGSIYALSRHDQTRFVWEWEGADMQESSETLTFTQPPVAAVYLSDLKDLILTSRSMPIESGQGEVQGQAIILRVTPVLSTLGEVRSTMYYQPAAMRPLELTTDEPLLTVHLNWWWEARDGVVYPVILARGARASALLEFTRVAPIAPARTTEEPVPLWLAVLGTIIVAVVFAVLGLVLMVIKIIHDDCVSPYTSAV